MNKDTTQTQATPPEKLAETTPPAPEEKPLSMAELEARNQENLIELGYTRKPKTEKKEEPAAVKPAEPPTAPAATTPPEKPAETPTEPEAKPKRKKPYADVVAEKISEGVKKALETVKPAEPPPAPAVKAPELSPKDLKTRRVLAVLAESPQYKDAVADFDSFVALERGYKANWEKEHPGVRFDSEAEEHAKFYEENEPQWDDEDFTDAKIELVTREKTAAIEQKNNHDRVVQDAIKKVERTQTEVVSNLIAEVDPKLGAKNVEDVDAKDPLFGELLVNQAPKLQALATEVDLLMTPGLDYKADEKNPTHQDLLKRMYAYENDIMRLPEDDRVWNGREFALIEDYVKMNPAQQRAHWTIFLEADQVKKLLVNDFAVQLRKKLDKLRPKSASQAPQAPPAATAQTPPPAASNSSFPSHSEGTDRVPVNPLNEKVGKSVLEELGYS